MKVLIHILFVFSLTVISTIFFIYPDRCETVTRGASKFMATAATRAKLKLTDWFFFFGTFLKI